jgi:hypothetical protein
VYVVFVGGVKAILETVIVSSGAGQLVIDRAEKPITAISAIVTKRLRLYVEIDIKKSVSTHTHKPGDFLKK